MSLSSTALLTWAPRILALTFAAFLALFALDVFEEGRGPLEVAAGLFIHLLPTTFLVLGILALAWRHAWVGAVAFLLLGVAYVVWSWGRMHWTAHLAIAGPATLIGLLFLASWLVERRGVLPAP